MLSFNGLLGLQEAHVKVVLQASSPQLISETNRWPPAGGSLSCQGGGHASLASIPVDEQVVQGARLEGGGGALRRGWRCCPVCFEQI